MRRLLAILLAVLSLTAKAATLHTIITNGSWAVSTQRNLVIFGDGWTSQAAFLRYCTNAATAWTNQAVWCGHPERWNVYAVHTNSVEDGTDVGGVFKNTVMDGAITGDAISIDATKRGNVYNDALFGTPLYDPAPLTVTVVNDGTYAGTSGGQIQSRISTNDTYGWDILYHEATGHTFANLKDEYDHAGITTEAADSSVKNLATSTTEGTNKWPFAVAVLGTPSLVSAGAYRPSDTCKMRALPAVYCLVCSNTISTNWLALTGLSAGGGGSSEPYIPSRPSFLNFGTLRIGNP